jgi:hypothetical protein
VRAPESRGSPPQARHLCHAPPRALPTLTLGGARHAAEAAPAGRHGALAVGGVLHAAVEVLLAGPGARAVVCARRVAHRRDCGGTQWGRGTGVRPARGPGCWGLGGRAAGWQARWGPSGPRPIAFAHHSGWALLCRGSSGSRDSSHRRPGRSAAPCSKSRSRTLGCRLEGRRHAGPGRGEVTVGHHCGIFIDRPLCTHYSPGRTSKRLPVSPLEGNSAPAASSPTRKPWGSDVLKVPVAPNRIAR